MCSSDLRLTDVERFGFDIRAVGFLGDRVAKALASSHRANRGDRRCSAVVHGSDSRRGGSYTPRAALVW